MTEADVLKVKLILNGEQFDAQIDTSGRKVDRFGETTAKS